MEEEVNIKEKLREGYIKAIIIIEILGRPPEHVSQTLEAITKVMKKDKNVILLDKKIYEPKKIQNSELYSSFVEVELLAKGLVELFGICFDYMPSSIEIIEPIELKFGLADANSLINDLASRLHQIEEVSKKLNLEKQILQAKLDDLLHGTPLINREEVTVELGEGESDEKADMNAEEPNELKESTESESDESNKGSK